MAYRDDTSALALSLAEDVVTICLGQRWSAARSSPDRRRCEIIAQRTDRFRIHPVDDEPAVMPECQQTCLRHLLKME